MRETAAACAGKRGYLLREQAERVAAELTEVQREANAGREPLRAYECPYCGRFHVGHVPLPPARRLS
jgi:hypothetical protein